MSKIYIIGMVASGKTTFANRLSEKLNIPNFELDTIIRPKTKNGRIKRTPEEQLKVIDRIDKNGDWIIEGTHRKNCHCLLDLADKIIFLDPPLFKRKYRIAFRFIKQQLGLEKCHYKSDLNMLEAMFRWTKDFEKNRVEFENMLSCYSEKLVVVNNTASLKKMLE